MTWQRPRDVAWVDQATSNAIAGFALTPGSGRITCMSGSGLLIWESAVEATSAAQIAQRIADVTGERASDIEHDIAAFVDQLVDAGLLEWV
ncbi:PqqD family protein [Rudaeicoccus suwonensis]|uniref:Coenzyme PQQ synthesis protein D (PqqD) n=1 Tax=Rudaeicoccus suwonensis TaxID=657409 RepID=A0A561E8Q1_9MICO|nr:PqqD family protein [Rudaeicoccus suwonensis]TWE11983.1 coenzyme PQQ synthesis protein D (PqqD) [Rudaeicoccus suwonensis]